MLTYPLVFGLGIWEIVIIALVIVLLFGATKIPQLMKGLGSGVRNFKEGLKEDDKKDTENSKKE